jgi:hypothetical protein
VATQAFANSQGTALTGWTGLALTRRSA